jgi:hypothetical protein
MKAIPFLFEYDYLTLRHASGFFLSIPLYVCVCVCVTYTYSYFVIVGMSLLKNCKILVFFEFSNGIMYVSKLTSI